MKRTVMTVPILALALVVGNGGAAPAQAVTPPGTGQLSGTMTDVISGEIIVRGYVCLEPVGGPRPGEFPKCGFVDSAGGYRIDDIPPGRWQSRASCRGDSPFAVPQLGRAQWAFAVKTRHTWNVVATTMQCDQRPLERITGEFTGYFYEAFETSWFAFDGRSDMFADADFSATRSQVNPTTVLPPDSSGSYGSCYRMTIEGFLTGPNHYVGRPIARYVLRATRIIRGQEIVMAQCDGWVDRIVPRHSSLPDEPAVDAVVEYLKARHAFTGERPAVVMCADVVEAIRPGERDRLSQEAAGVVSSYNVAERCDDAPPPAGGIPNLTIQDYSGRNSYGGEYPAVRTVRIGVDGAVLIERFIRHPGRNRIEYSTPNPP